MSVKSSGGHEPRRRFARTGRQLFQHRLSVFALTGRLLSLHRPNGARELPQACSPLTGGEFSAEPQRGDSPPAGGGSVPRPAAGTTPYPRRWAKRKDNLRFSFLFELLPFPWRVWRRFPICDRSETGERQSGYRSVSFSAFSQFTDSVLLHIRFTLRRRNMTVLRNPLVWSLRTAPTD